MNSFEILANMNYSPTRIILIFGFLFSILYVMLKIDKWFWKIGVLPKGLLCWFKERKK